MEDLKQSQRLLWYVLLIFVGAYTALLFPFAYFRHDDWLNLGNAILRVPQNWNLLFSTTWIENGIESVWFFRPLFKLSYYLGYKAFGFCYYGWLASTLILTLLALWAGYQTVLLITRSVNAASFFVVFFAGNLHFHLGSLLWVGEGFMNVPSVFLLATSAYCFTRYLKEGLHIKWQWLSILTFVLALGYKESSFAQVLLLTGIYFTVDKKPFWHLRPLVPHFLLTAVYLIVRLFYLPINPFYHPKLSLALPNFLYFIFAFGVPCLGLVICFGRKWNLLWKPRGLATGSFLLFLLAVILPHQGHPFFSPGWLLLPGFFLSLIIAISMRDVGSFKLTMGPWLLIFVLSFVVVFAKMQSVEWWKWGQAQREMHSLLESISPEKMAVVRIRDCSTLPVNPARILGYHGAISDWYEAIHGKSLDIKYVPCNTPRRFDWSVLWYDWKFPHLVKSIDN